jgi:hypothetical protein
MIIVLNLVAGDVIWSSKVQGISQIATANLHAHLTQIEALVARPDMLQPDVLQQLATELTEVQNDLHSLQATLPTISELGIGSSTGTSHALALGIDMAQATEGIVGASIILQPDLAGFADSMLNGPTPGAGAKTARLTIADVEAAQRDVAQAKSAWQQALADWSAFSFGVPDLPSADLNTITRLMDTLSQQMTVGLTALSAVLDWSPALLGLQAPENLLLVEENPDVLRPTGGAITHYAVLTINNGALVSGIRLQNVVALDCPDRVCTTSALPAIPSWFPLSLAPVQVGDANLDPDLTASGWSIYNHFEHEGGPPVMGIIVATEGLYADILGAIGPVTVARVPGSFTAQNVAQRLRAYRAAEASSPELNGAPSDDIDILLVQAIAARLPSLTAAQRMTLGHALVRALIMKDLQIFTGGESRVQSSMEAINVAGQVLAPSGDSLEIVDTNLSGAPINPFIDETATDRITLDARGEAQHQLHITYHYTALAGASPPPAYVDVVRAIVPNNSVGAVPSGPCAPVHATQAYHTVMACEFTVAPGATVTIGFSWRATQGFGSASSSQQAYSLLLQRQPGATLDLQAIVSAPAGRTFATAAAPGRLADGQLLFSATPLLSDTMLQASLTSAG